MNANLIINKGKIRIRPMLISDVSTYIAQFNLDEESKIEAIKKFEKDLKKNQEKDVVYDFTIEYENNIIGAVVTQVYGEFLNDGIVVIDIPSKKYKFLCARVKEIFIKLLRKTYLYDDVIFTRTSNLKTINISNLKKIPIACWKTRATSV